MLILDNFALFFNLIFVLVAVITVLISFTYMEREDLENGEYYVLLLFSVAGLMLMASAGDLIIVFLGLELLSLPLYMLAGFSPLAPPIGRVGPSSTCCWARSRRVSCCTASPSCTERPKTTNLAGIATAVAQDGFSTLLLIGLGLLIVGWVSRLRSCLSICGHPTSTRAHRRPSRSRLYVGSSQDRHFRVRWLRACSSGRYRKRPSKRSGSLAGWQRRR